MVLTGRPDEAEAGRMLMATVLARPGLEALVDRQCRVVTRAQLRGHGIGAAAVRAAVAAERWSLVGDSVVLLQTGVPTQVQSWWIGVLHAADWTGHSRPGRVYRTRG